MIDYTRLQIFLQSAECLSFTEAARYLHVTQSTISRQIKALEQNLGAQLFERSGAGLRLTEAGRLLVPRARKLLCQTCEIASRRGDRADSHRVQYNGGQIHPSPVRGAILPRTSGRMDIHPEVHTGICHSPASRS